MELSITLALAQGAFKLLMAMLAIIVARGTLLWLDLHLGGHFDRTMQEASSDARMHYFAARIVAVCIVVGLAIS
jgi:hypothetical protein